MKKLFLSILMMVYMMVSSGIAMEIHYCMGKQVGVDLYSSEDDRCGKCGMKEKKNGCCSDEHKFYKLEDAHKNVSNDLDYTTTVIPFITPSLFFDTQLQAPTSFVSTEIHTPPIPSGPRLGIMHCTFRI